MIFPLTTWLLAYAALLTDAPWWLRALVCLPAVLLAPGWGWAAWLGGRATRLQRALDAAWLSVALCVPTVALVRLMAGDGATVLHASLAWGLLGAVLARRAPAPRPDPGGGALGVALLALGLAGFTAWQADALTRPLDAYWYHPQADEEGHDPLRWAPVEGFGPRVALGWPEAGAGMLPDPEGDGGAIEVAEAGRLLVLLRGPVGAGLAVGQDDAPRGLARIERDVVEVEEEGAVPRYLDRGVVAQAVAVLPGRIDVEVVDADGPAQIYVLPGTEAVWSAHADGALRFVHYYQLLNIVENLRWAQELTRDRWLTVNQPPLWSNVLAPALLLVEPGLLGANALFLWVLALLGLGSLRLLQRLAADATPVTWALPALGAVTVGRLMVEPGSTTFPDPLYAAAMVAALAALKQPAAGRFAALGLAAGLLRYPGVVALTLMAGVFGAVERRLPLRPLGALWGATAGLAALLGLGALLSGQLQDWLFILWFETGPEHYHGDYSAGALLSRPPEFYATWLRYTGYGLLAALPLAGRGAKQALGAAALYSLLLCTIDHFPSHYFLPLVALSGVAVGANAAAVQAPALRWGLPLAALAGGVWFLGWSWV
ncbi:MAG: hypothetical protein H6739_15350 [Alphaproteobacteria bacterium]|nr:hypothetical protein [Alphaproteobacteria bacterium]